MPDEIFILVVMSLASVTALGFGLMRSINRHLDRKWQAGRAGGDERVLPEVEDLRSRLEGMEEVHARVLELEERVDFAERRLRTEGKDQKASQGSQ